MTRSFAPPSYLHRDIAHLVRRGLRSLPVLMITGLRQSGKTTFLRNDPLFKSFRFLDLDDFAVLEAAREDPQRFVDSPGPLIIDEVQRCPELLRAIKHSVDRRREPSRFVLSGSANLALLEGVSETLAGRALYLELHPFSRRERFQAGADPFLPTFLREPESRFADTDPEMPPIDDDEVLGGGMPPVVTTDIERRFWFLGYTQTYVERDVRNLHQIADLVPFRSLMQLAALRTGQLLNLSELGRDARVSTTTAGRYIGLLETSFLAQRLPPFLRSRGQRLIKSPKFFFADSGLACHLTGVDDLRPEGGEPLRGALWETWVYQNLRGVLDAFLPEADLAFWSIQGRYEVDFVLSHGRRTLAIEVKAGRRFGRADLRGLKAFLDRGPEESVGVLAYNGKESLALGERLYAIPLARLLS